MGLGLAKTRSLRVGEKQAWAFLVAHNLGCFPESDLRLPSRRTIGAAATGERLDRCRANGGSPSSPTEGLKIGRASR